MTWIELNTDDEVEHNRITIEHGNLRARIWGPFELIFGAFSYQSFNIEKLPLVITFRDKMQKVMDAKTPKDTALYRAGMELIRDLRKLILEFKTDESTHARPAATTESEEAHEENDKSMELLDRLRACMTWVEDNTTEVQKQDLVKSAHTTILGEICGSKTNTYGFGESPSWDTKNLNLVRDFEVEMQTVIDKPPQKDTDLRIGMELLRELVKLRQAFTNEESTDTAFAPAKQTTNSALSSLLAQLTNGA
jgi:hypothetical protein